ncbi:hypothetical protein GEMRC1_011808 [Eukaryota sp. GEM-RC1]
MSTPQNPHFSDSQDNVFISPPSKSINRDQGVGYAMSPPITTSTVRRNLISSPPPVKPPPETTQTTDPPKFGHDPKPTPSGITFTKQASFSAISSTSSAPRKHLLPPSLKPKPLKLPTPKPKPLLPGKRNSHHLHLNHKLPRNPYKGRIPLWENILEEVSCYQRDAMYQVSIIQQMWQVVSIKTVPRVLPIITILLLFAAIWYIAGFL